MEGWNKGGEGGEVKLQLCPVARDVYCHCDEARLWSHHSVWSVSS